MYNEALPMPSRPELPDLEEGVIRGGYCLESAVGEGPRINLLGSGTILFEVIEAASRLRQEGFAVAVYSITSYIELARDAEQAENSKAASWLSQLFDEPHVPTVAASDYVRTLPRMIASWVPGPLVALGTDGFGMSERREALRAHFRIDAHAIAETARSLVKA